MTAPVPGRRDAVPFFDLQAQLASIRPAVRAALEGVLDDGGFTNGPAVAAFETQFAAYGRVPHCVAVNNGTSALHLALGCFDVRPGDEVITVSMSFIATAWPILYAGATPVFVEVDRDRFTMDPKALERAITPRTKAIIVVHLYGQMADMDPILGLAAAHGIPVIEDCAQAHGAEYKGRRAGSLGTLGCFSFYPSKNLGAYGEGGAVTTRDDALAERCRRVRNHGQKAPYVHTDVGHNFRMNSFQGAILSVKLAHLEAWTARRGELAAAYGRALEGAPVIAPAPCTDGRHVWHLYVIRHPRRDALRAALEGLGVHTAVHYPAPIHLQPVFEGRGFPQGSLPVTEAIARDCVSLPLYPEMPAAHVDRVAEAIRRVSV
jgi:dTDP-4-amino-4,6-dideoxygalactose transaminase